MKKIIPVFMLFLAAALITVSCKSVPQALYDEYSESKNRAQAARQRAIEFESNAYFPSEWEQAETQFNAGKVSDKPKKDELEKATEANYAAVDSYNDLYKRAVPLYALAREEEILETRESLINTGFTKYFPDFLKDADDIAITAQEQYETDDYYAAKKTAIKAMDEYETLHKGAEVFLARQEIIDRGFVKYDEENFAKADEIADLAVSEYQIGNKEAAIKTAEEALRYYELVLENAWRNYSVDRRASASKERELAIAERANIASREIFREAEVFYQTAEENFASEKFDDAGKNYIEAEALFAIAREDTAEKRKRAEEAIKMAEERIEESEETAIEAERLIEGGSR